MTRVGSQRHRGGGMDTVGYSEVSIQRAAVLRPSVLNLFVLTPHSQIKPLLTLRSRIFGSTPLT
jgi:hypothetical protein